MSKLVVITGASRGLGLVLAHEFSARGWEVAGTGRSDRPDSFPSSASYHQFDASDWSACQSFWSDCANKIHDGGVYLINNAGGYISGSLTDTSPEAYDKQMKSIYYSAVYMTRGLAQVTKQARIVNVISNSALVPHKNNSAYGAAKAAEMHFFQSLQKEFSPGSLRITNLYPSDIASHGPNPDAIKPEDIALFIREQMDNNSTYYLSDATLFPVNQSSPN